MNYYFIRSILLNEEAYISLVDDKNSDIKFYFLYDEGECPTEVIFQAQEGFNQTTIYETDLYSTDSSLLVFSESFYKCMGSIINNEVNLHPAKIKIKESFINCYVAKIENIQDILDRNLTVYDNEFSDNSDDEETFIDYPVFKGNINNFIYCVKNTSEQQFVIFSEKFKSLCLANNMKIRMVTVDKT